LQPQTQVFVSPKHRASSSGLLWSVSADSTEREFATADANKLETVGELSDADVQNSSEMLLPLNRLVSGFKQLLFGSDTDPRTDDLSEMPTYRNETWNVNTKLVCRVLALEDFAVGRSCIFNGRQKMLDASNGSDNKSVSHESIVDSADLMLQPANVYVSIFTILSELPCVSVDAVSNTFLAVLSRLRSPSEQLSVNRIRRAKAAYSSSDDAEESDDMPVNGQTCCVVRVIVTDFNNEARSSGVKFMQPLPAKHVLISSLLRRQLNLTVTHKVALVPLCTPSDMSPAKIHVYSLCSGVSCLICQYILSPYVHIAEVCKVER